MAGIRGAKDPMPTKTAKVKGPFKAGSVSGSFDRGAVASAKACNRKGPTSGRNSGTSAGASHYANAGLKRGTSNRG